MFGMSYVWGLVFLHLAVKNFHGRGLVFLRFGVRNSNVWGLGILTVGG